MLTMSILKFYILAAIKVDMTSPQNLETLSRVNESRLQNYVKLWIYIHFYANFE